MKKSTIRAILILGLVLVAGVFLYLNKDKGADADKNVDNDGKISVSETSKITNKKFEYSNAELGFSIEYPDTWEKGESDTGVAFELPIDQSQVSTINTLKADINVFAGKCTFPPVTTIKERSTITFGSNSFSMISMANNVQGREYFNRMYSLQKEAVCYMFTFSSIALSPSSKNLTGSNLTQAQNNNKALVSTADAEFIEMVRSFDFVVGPQGQDETSAAAPTN